MSEKAHFYLPDFYVNCRLILFFYEMMKRNPEFFFEQAQITAVYGCFPGSIWNGGRDILGSTTKEEIEYVLNEFNSRGIAVRYTFTNPVLEKKHFYDTFCNLTLELSNNGMNEVLVNSGELEEYIRTEYPKMKLLSSTTKCLNTREEIERELQEDYPLVVLDSAWNNTDQLFAMPHHEKIELLVNHYCRDNCPKRKAHYEEIGKSQLEFRDSSFEACPFVRRSFYEVMENCSFITTELLYGSYMEHGFVHFKLDGRSFPRFKVMESFIYYFVKPEWRDYIRMQVLGEIDRLR